MPDHEVYMRRCITLALKGGGYTAPNPLVGAVLVHQGRIIGEGFHEYYGGLHAEVNCLRSVAEIDFPLIRKSTLYVSLEPCSHFGKTPPCTDLIIDNEIPEVVIGCTDSFEKVKGSGISKLAADGIKVTKDILHKECRGLNKRFFTFHEKHRPYILLKWAQSADGFIAGEKSARIKISNESTDSLVHQWRAAEAAILAGTNTVLSDDPSLTVRHVPGRNPVRAVIDPNLDIPSSAKVYDEISETIIINRKKNATESSHIFFKIGEEESIEEGTIRALFERRLVSVMIEGGAKTLQSFIDAGLWDEAKVITNTGLYINSGIASPVLKDEIKFSEEKIFSDHIGSFKKKTNEFL